MATITTLKTTPHTRIENSIIVHMAEIGVYPYAVYSAIKMHLNQASGACFPSYATIARITGIHRTTVIDCVKTLKTRKLLSPHWRYEEDGGYASNQYDFPAREAPVPAKKVVQNEQASRPELPPPGRPELPEQNEEKEKKTTRPPSQPTKKQQSCPHPPTETIFLPDNITICNHCFGLLDENLMLQAEEKSPVEIVAA